MQWLSAGKSDLAIFNSGGGDYLFMSDDWRLKRASVGDANATIQAFVSSSQGAIVDGTNGSVQFITSDTPAAIAAAVWAHATRSLTESLDPSATQIASAVWGDNSRTLTASLDPSATQIADVVWTNTTRGLTQSLDPTPTQIASAVRGEIAAELGHLDVDVSSRLATATYAAEHFTATDRATIEATKTAASNAFVVSV
jgi:hypothetical protein